MNRLNIIDWISFVLVIVGALNWFLVGVFKWNLVDAIFGIESFLSRLVYIIVGLAAIYLVMVSTKLARK